MIEPHSPTMPALSMPDASTGQSGQASDDHCIEVDCERSNAPPADAEKAYQDSIREWLSQDGKDGSPSSHTTDGLPGNERALHSIPYVLNPIPVSAIPRSGSLGARLGRVASSRASPAILARLGPTEKEFAKEETVSADGDKRLPSATGAPNRMMGRRRSLMPTASSHSNLSDRHPLYKPSGPRLRGTKLKPCLNEVDKQKNIVFHHTASEDASIHPEAEWALGTEKAGGKDPIVVAAILSKASSYSAGGRENVTRQLNHDGEASLLYWIAILVPYLKVAGFIILAAVDLVLALVFQVFWSKSDFMCISDTQTDDVYANKAVLIALGAVVFLHSFRSLYKLVHFDGGGDRVGLRFFYSTELFGLGGLWTNNVEFFISISSITLLYFHAADCEPASFGSSKYRHTILRRLHSHIHVIRSLFEFQRCFSMKQYLRKQLQSAVSANKRRFICADSDLNLDLTYVCDRLIAMAIPCVDHTMYRNDIREVARFFAIHHYGTFLVYNLCENHEEGGNGNYDPCLLYNQVQRVTFYDHNVPRLRCVIKFCETASEWLNGGDKNIVAVHCQGGKGRTGTFCSALMLWTGLCDTAQEAMDKFALRRTQRMRFGESLQGVAAPCQIRYVHYVEALIYEGVDYQAVHYMLLHRINLDELQTQCMQGFSMTFIIEVDGIIRYDHGKSYGFLNWAACQECNFTFDVGNVIVFGDVTVRFYFLDEDEVTQWAHSCPSSARVEGTLGPGARTIKYGSVLGKQAMFVSFHSAFHDQDIVFYKNEIDGAYNSPESKYPSNFSIQIGMKEFLPGPMGPTLSTSSQNLTGLAAFIPQKVDPAMKHLQTRDAVKNVFERLCPHMISFEQGASILQQVRPRHITLHYIVSGATTTLPPTSNTGSNVQAVKIFFDAELHGAGEILHCGMEQFLGEFESTHAHYAGCKVKTRTIELPLSENNFLPLQVEGIAAKELADIYSYFAHQLSSKMLKCIDKICKINGASVTKRNTRSSEGHWSKKMMGELHHRFGIPKSEVLAFGSKAHNLKDVRQSDAGHAYVLTNWVAFVRARTVFSSSGDILIRIKDIVRIEANGNLLEITMANKEMSWECGTSSPRSPHSSVNLSDWEFSDHFANSARQYGSFMDRIPSSKSRNSHSSASSLPERTRQTSAVSSSGPLTIKFPSQRQEHMRAMGLIRNRFTGAEALLRFPDEENCQLFTNALKELIGDVKAKELKKTEGNTEGELVDMTTYKFGYILPGEEDEEEGKDFLQHLLNISEVCVFAAGDAIFHMHDSGRRLCHIISGTALRCSQNQTYMEDIGPGCIAGEGNFLSANNGSARAFTVLAATQVKCFMAPIEQVQTLCTLRPCFAARFYRGITLCCIIRAHQFRRIHFTSAKHSEEEHQSSRLPPNALNSRLPSNGVRDSRDSLTLNCSLLPPRGRPHNNSPAPARHSGLLGPEDRLSNPALNRPDD